MIRTVVGLLVVASLAAGADDLVERWKTLPRVTLKAKKITVAVAVAKICKKTRQQAFETVDEPGKVISLNLERATFFEAIEEVALRGGLAVDYNVSRARFALRKFPDGMTRMPVTISGPVRIELLGIYSTRSAARRFSPASSRESTTPQVLRVQLRAVILPGFADAHLSAVEMTRVRDDAEGDMLDTRVVDNPYFNLPFYVNLKSVGRGSLKVMEFTGKTVLFVPRKIEQVKFSGGARNSSRKLGGGAFKIIEIDRPKSSNRATIKASIEGTICEGLGKKPDLKVMTHYRKRSSAPLDPAVIGLYAYEKDGEPISGSVLSIRSMIDGVITISLYKRPSKIVVKAATSVSRKDISFRFPNIPIPR